MTRVLFHVLGDSAHGMGHIMRCLHLAHALHKRNVETDFLTIMDTPGEIRLTNEFLMSFVGISEDDCATLAYSFGMTHNYQAIIIDLEHGPSRELLEMVRGVYPKVITMGGVGFAMSDPEALADLVDLQIYQSVGPFPPYGISQALWDAGKKLTGPEWIIINPKLRDCTPDPSGPIVVAMGGGDPHRLTEIAMRKLEGANLRVICGPARPPIPGTIIAPESLVPHLDGASLYVGAFGMTTYEALCAGVPCLVTNWSEDHERTARLLEAHSVINLGQWNEFEDAPLAGLITPAMLDWSQTSARGRNLIDGLGGARVAEEICQLIAGQ